MYDKKTIKNAQKEEKRLLSLDKRLYNEDVLNTQRSPFAKDYARIIYSSSFLRLQGKMQLLGIKHTEFSRNRLTHSFTVAQVAREIASNLQLSTNVVCETASLAHDLGNPPFGHYGERILDRLTENIGGFEGNAQTFRILHYLEKHHIENGGLNLTLRTLLSVIKYFKTRNNGDNKKFIYDEDFHLIADKLEEYSLGNEPNTIDMQIMDLADEIAYAAHDLEDCLKLRHFTIDEFLHEFRHHKEYKSAYKKINNMVEVCRKFAGKANRTGTSEEFSFIFRNRLTTLIVDTLVKDIFFSQHKNRLAFRNYEILSLGLKKLTFIAVTKKPEIHLYEKTGEKVIEGLFKVYSDEKYNEKLILLSPEYRKFEDDNDRLRKITDFISGMMDSFAMKEYETYFGSDSLRSNYFKREPVEAIE